MTEKEARAMLGVEFTYMYDDGDSIQAYVKAYDPEKGMTCYTLGTETERDRWKPRSNDPDLAPDGTWCIIAYDAGDDKMFKTLKEIRDTGSIVVPAETMGIGFMGCQF